MPAVKKMIKAAKKRGFVTYDELNAVLPSDPGASEQIEDTMSMLNDMGINVSRRRGRRGDRTRSTATWWRDDDGGRQDHHQAEPTDRTDDPVRMYLREMGTVELLSREGEIAIAKRIEAGREAMIAGFAKAR
jgi:RNA polymerase primary sigma factor